MGTSRIPDETLFQALPTPLLLLDDRLRVQAANAAFCRAFHLDSQKILTRPVETLVGVSRTHLEAALAGNAPLEVEPPPPERPVDGSRKFRLHARPIQFDAAALLLLTFEEIARQWQTEEIRSRLAALVESSEDAIISKTLEGTIVTWNSAAARLFGYTQQEAVGQSITMLFPPELLSEEAELLTRVRRGEQISDYETVRVRKNGQRIDVAISVSPIRDETGAVIGVSKIAREITRRKREDKRLRQLLEVSPDAMVVIDKTGTITHVNVQTRVMFGYAEEALVGQALEILVPERLRQTHAGHREQYFAAPRPRPMGARQELYGLRQDGSEFPVEISLSPVAYEDAVLIAAAIRDVTERRRSEQLRAELERERELNELQARFVSMVSHEFRTPMSAIQTSAELILLYSDRMSGERKNEHLLRIQEHIHHLTILLDDILTLGKAQSVGLDFVPVPLDLAALCGTVVRTLEPVDRDGRIRQTVTVCPQVMADPKLLTQVLTNLLSNALKYSPPTSPVALTVACADDQVVFRVSDRGIGIPEGEQKQLFQLFRRTSNVGDIPGTGLGLVIVKEAVKAHGGTIAVESELGAGTTFTVTIPLLPGSV